MVAIGVVFTPFRQVFTFYTVYSEAFGSGVWDTITTSGSEFYNPLLATVISFEIIINFIFMGLSVFLIYLLFTKSARFPKYFIGITLFAFLFIIIDAWVTTKVIPDKPMFDTETTKELVRASIALFIWVPCMLLSKRVKATFR